MNRPVLLAFGVGLGLLMQQAVAAGSSGTGAEATELVFIGTHGGGGGGPPPGAPMGGPDAGQPSGAPGGAPGPPRSADKRPQGIYSARLDLKTGHLTPLGAPLELPRATWLISHPKLPVIYSVASGAGGMQANSDIYSLGIDTKSGQLHLINKQDAGGSDATHLDIDARSNTLFSANHGSGDVSALPMMPDGSLGPVVSDQKDYGIGPNRRQRTPAAHGVAVDPKHKYVLVADFGADRLFIYHFDGATRRLSPSHPPFEPYAPGSGPRHLVFDPSGKFLFVDTELTAELRSYYWDESRGLLHLIQKIDTYQAPTGQEKSAAELATSRDGRFLYLSLRDDQDCIVVYEINRKRGTLKEIQRLSAQGKNPWSFGIDPTGQWMLVTNEGSGSVAVLKVDRKSGRLGTTGQSLEVPSPVTVAFYKH